MSDDTPLDDLPETELSKLPDESLDYSEVAGWAKLTSYDDLVDAYKHFYDRWNWKTGSSVDHTIFTILEEEIKTRDKEKEAMEAIAEEFRKMEVDVNIYKIFHSATERQAAAAKRKTFLHDLIKEMSDKTDDSV